MCVMSVHVVSWWATHTMLCDGENGLHRALVLGACTPASVAGASSDPSDSWSHRGARLLLLHGLVPPPLHAARTHLMVTWFRGVRDRLEGADAAELGTHGVREALSVRC